jgi:hypothetical protein
VECKNKSNTSNDRGNWNHLTITKTITEQRSREEQNQGNTKTSHIGHCTYTSESTNVKVKGKVLSLQAYMASRVSRSIALPFLDRGIRRG